jgi:hypothetical protein
VSVRDIYRSLDASWLQRNKFIVVDKGGSLYLSLSVAEVIAAVLDEAPKAFFGMLLSCVFTVTYCSVFGRVPNVTKSDY